MTVVDNNPGDHQLVMYELVGEVGEARANLVLSLAWVPLLNPDKALF